MNLFNFLFIIRPMRFYTVLYTCARGYNCFRTIEARTPSQAEERCRELTHNFGELTEVRPYVGQ